jgi:2-isopropylmalate synthase
VGRTYESIIRINSQSGKGGVAYVLEKEYGLSLPREMHPEFGRIIQTISDRTGREVMPDMIWEAFEKEFLGAVEPLTLKSCRIKELRGSGRGRQSSVSEIRAVVVADGVRKEITGKGNGPIDAFSNALRDGTGTDFSLVSYYEHSLEKGSASKAVAYIKIEDGRNRKFWGAGIDTSIDTASFKAILSALNRSARSI